MTQYAQPAVLKEQTVQLNRRRSSSVLHCGISKGNEEILWEQVRSGWKIKIF